MQASKITPLYGDQQIQIQSGIIESCDEQGYQISCNKHLFEATKAFSCLIEPTRKDTVLFSTDANGRCHILSIIERHSGSESSLVFPGDVTLNAARGQLNINGQQGINISSQQSINQTSAEYAIIANKALFGIDSVTAIGTKLVAKITSLQTFANSVETIADNMLQKLKNSIRLIEGVDQNRAMNVISTVKNLYSLRSKQAAIIAKKDIKVDAERIHMG